MSEETHPEASQEREKLLPDENKIFVDNLSYKTQEEITQKIPQGYDTLSAEKLLEKFQKLLKEELTAEIQNIVASVRRKFYEKIQERRKKKLEIFLAEGGEEVDFHYSDPLEKTFNEIYKIYTDKRKARQEALQREQELNLKSRLEIIEALKNLYINPTPMSADEAFKRFSALKKRWSDTGKIPAINIEETFENYRYHLENFYRYLELNKELKEIGYTHNLEQRNIILSRLEELINEPKIAKALNELHYLQRLWREEATPVGETHEKSTKEKLEFLGGKILERKKILDQEIIQEQQENLLQKKEIIKKIENLTESLPDHHKQWQKLTEKISALEKDFMSIGKVPQEEKETLWKRFKNILRNFYHEKNQFYKQFKEVQRENLKKKKKLLEQAKVLQESSQWKETGDLLKKMQIQWKQIGAVPIKHAVGLWKDFQEACNHFFERYKTRSEMHYSSKERNHHINGEDEKFKTIKRISDIQENILQLENNIQFFAHADKENPLVKMAHEKVEEERALLKSWKEKYKTLKNSKTVVSH
ncbi:DUF349 domain-containing protein [Bacteroidetes bacterium endosymbiont of Geopemphigus sp.]|uniref:DUF349 domain-containing protein n=1 Tax=Bacteroidetes bacterium endosymbiont of Geopemphigus sp. TaxID=2047937 RepID=UPI000CD18C01|nr:DUF349 domain-containing protein [Bacteroidetes bacterium endosymbiont of Geopemphigus sp.]